jgi:endonuclease/exonuclease/phosphatase family metal-dependent hydrolase
MKNLFKYILVIINLLAAVAVLLVLLCRVVSPESFSWLALAALLFPVLALVNVLFILIWIFSRKWFFLISTTALLLCFRPVSENFSVHARGSAAQAAQNENEFTIVSYNVGAYSFLKKTEGENDNKLVKYILESNADVLCLQELAVSKNPQFMTEADVIRCFGEYPYRHIQYKTNNYDRIGIATFSKFPIVNRQQVDYPSRGNLSIFSDIALRGDTVRIVNNHLESNAMPHVNVSEMTDANGFERNSKKLTRRLLQIYPVRAKQADIIAKTIEKSPQKIIVLGDFNDVPSSYVYAKIKGKLRDAFTEAGTGLGWTYNSSIYRVRIDYILHSDHFEVRSFETGNKEYSDHYPVICKLSTK